MPGVALFTGVLELDKMIASLTLRVTRTENEKIMNMKQVLPLGVVAFALTACEPSMEVSSLDADPVQLSGSEIRAAFTGTTFQSSKGWQWTFNSDGTQNSGANDGSWTSAGSWTVKGDQLCRDSERHAEYCSDIFLQNGSYDFTLQGEPGMEGWDLRPI